MNKKPVRKPTKGNRSTRRVRLPIAFDQDAIRARIALLPKGLRRHVNPSFGMLPDVPKTVLVERAKAAKELSDATGGLVRVVFSPGTYFDADLKAFGNTYHALPSIDSVVRSMTLDAREPDLFGQLAEELRSAAAELEQLAAIVESHKPNGADPPAKRGRP